MAGDRLDEDHRGQLAAGEDVVADGDLAVDAVLDEALVDPFVAAGHEDEARMGGELAHEGVVETLALGRKVDDVAGGIGLRLRGLEGGIQHVDLHHHAVPAAEGLVVDGAVAVGGVLADIVEVEVEEAGIAGALDDGDVERPGKRLGEEGEDVDPHPSCSTGPASSSAMWGTRGRRTARPSATPLGLPEGSR